MLVMYALVDCNNFFVSCERLFRPDLINKPVIVLSNNDGCAVSRSNEARELMPMGAPYFKYESVIKQNDIQCFSANFHLYGDMSRRVMEVLYQLSPEIEQYSVDEAFIDLSKISIDDYETWSKQASARVLRWTGITVRIGVGQTKTIAKLATERAKSENGNKSWAVFEDNKTPEILNIQIEEVWGIGRRLAPRLRQFGIHKVADLIKLRPHWARQFAGSTFMNTVLEIQGQDIFGSKIQFNEPSKQTISATRTFGQRITKQHELESAVADFVTRAAFRMRKNKKLASKMYVFAQNSKHDYKLSTISNSVSLDVPTDHTGKLIQSAIDALTQVYEPGLSYKRAGITMLDLVPRTAQQMSLDQKISELQLMRGDKLMQAIDKTRTKFGNHALAYAITQNKNWSSVRAKQTSAYTTSWLQLPVLR